MKLKLFRVVLMLFALTAAFAAGAQKDPYVGDVAMSPKKTLLENLTASPIHTEFLKALRTTQLDQSLSSGGPYTIFAPTDDAWRRLHPTASANPLTGDALVTALEYHIVQGKLTTKQIRKRIKKGHSSITLQTMAGSALTVKRYGSVLVLTDSKGGTTTLITTDVLSKGGVFHVIDAVLLP